MNKNMEWKSRVSEIFQTCQEELKRTTEIGKKMISASKMNTLLHDTYEDLGRLATIAIKEGTLKWDDPRIDEIMSKIESYENDLEKIEGDVNNIKFSDQAKKEAEEQDL